MTIQGPPGNNSNHPEPIRGNGNASRAHQVPFTTPLPVDHLLGKLFKYLTRCGRGVRAVRILPLKGGGGDAGHSCNVTDPPTCCTALKNRLPPDRFSSHAPVV